MPRPQSHRVHTLRRRAAAWRRFAVVTGILVGGFAARSPADTTIQLVGYLAVPNPAYDTDVWGWVDPATDIEYALVGNNATGLHIVDVSNPAVPVIVSTMDTVLRFDIKTYEHFAYTVDGNYGFAGQWGNIIDISDPYQPVVVGIIRPGHNLFVDAQGFLYICYPGIKIYDLKPDPTHPMLVWEKVTTEGHDATVVGNTLYDFHGFDGTFIYDVTDHGNPVLLGSITDTTITYHHSGWPSADGRYLFLNDEFSVDPFPDITVWDLQDPSAPVRVAEIGDPDATVHNSYVIGDRLYAGYYTAGFRLYDVADPTSPVLLDEYDTGPQTGEAFEGAWGCYPFAPSGNVYINDRPNGFFIFSILSTPVGAKDAPPIRTTLGPSYPNPFNPSTTIPYTLTEAGTVEVAIYDVRGGRVRTLFRGWQRAGLHRAVWDGYGDDGERSASGVYLCRLTTPEGDRSTKLTLIE